jgi:hypothetical protein
MAKQASKTVIGVFVVSSIAMLIAGVIIFGSGEMFKKTNELPRRKRTGYRQRI